MQRNHCPACLYGKHVDENPGDRASRCAGMMEPTSVEVQSTGHVIVHRCRKCGLTKRNKAAPDDSMDAIIDLMRRSTGGTPG